MIHDELAAMAARVPASVGLRERGSFLPYALVLEEVDRLAAAFLERGVGPHSVVATVQHNGPELFIVAHALFAIGAVAMPLGPAGTPEEHAFALRRSGATAVVAEPGLAEAARRAVAASGRALPVWVRGEGGDLAAAALGRAGAARLPRVPPETPALYMLSSGSTGLPKIVPHTHAELLADGRRTSGAWRLTPDDLVFDMLPPNFAMGFLLGAIDAATAGASVVYWHDPRPLLLARNDLLGAIEGERATMMGAVPAMYQAMLGAKETYDLGCLRLAFSGGAALPQETYTGFRDRFGIRLRQDYGSTEAIMVSHNDADDVDRLWASVGKPAGDAVVRVDPAEGHLGPGTGELLIASSSLASGYLDEPDATAQSFRDGWLRSGDLGRIDEEGNIFILGRIKLIIEVGGFKIDPLEVEAVLAEHDAVAEAVVVGVLDRGREQRLKAVVVRAADVTPEALIRHMRGRLSAAKVPTLIEFRDSLPRSEAGKVLRARLAEEG